MREQQGQNEGKQKNINDEGAGSTSSQSQLLTFTLGEEEYGVNIMCVKEIRAWNDTTRLPNAIRYMRGVINLRGLVVPIFDLRLRFGLEKTNATSKNAVIIVKLGNRTIGVLVDTVSDILNINEDEIRNAPTMDVGVDSEFVAGLVSREERMVVVLEIEKMFERSAHQKTEEIISHDSNKKRKP